MSGTGADDQQPGRYLFDALYDFLRRDGWPVADEDAGQMALAVPVETEAGRWVCAGNIINGRAVLCFSSIVPVFVPEPARSGMAEFLHRANEGLLYGGFQFDLDEGEVRYVTTLDLTDVDAAALQSSGVLTGLIRRLIYANVAGTDQYYSAVMAVAHAGMDPSEAVARAERD